MLLFMVFISYASEPWYKKRIYISFDNIENTWLHKKLEDFVCDRDNFVRWLLGNPQHCNHRECHR